MKFYLDNAIFTEIELVQKMKEDLSKSIENYDCKDSLFFLLFDYERVFRQEPIEIKSPLEMYNTIYRIKKDEFLKKGFNEDKASRKANIYAVKNTWEEWIK